jgi:hypothetical protein
MSWASRRKTTRPEDVAYCLMGLFNVNMPILYGKGSYKAFRRLQEEIMKISFNCSIFAWVFHYAESGLLALEPADFADAPKLLLWSRRMSPHEMTNMGLAIKVRTVELPRHSWYPFEITHAALDIDVQTEYGWGVVVLRLKREMTEYCDINGELRHAYRRVGHTSTLDAIDPDTYHSGSPEHLLVLKREHLGLLNTVTGIAGEIWGNDQYDDLRRLEKPLFGDSNPRF